MFGPLSVVKNLSPIDPLALHLVVDDLEERVGKLEAIAESHQFEQRKVLMQIEHISANQNKLFLQLDRIERQLSSQVQMQPYNMCNSWGPSSTPVYSDQHINTLWPQDSWDDSFSSKPSLLRPASPPTIHPNETSKQTKSPERSPAAPRATEINNVNPDNTLPSSVINKEKLAEVKVVITKYPKLKMVSKASTLTVKLAKEAIFGEDVMKRCTVAGTREYPDLPFDKLQELKQIVFEQFPQYWKTPFEFEDVWKICFEALGQACKRLRK